MSGGKKEMLLHTCYYPLLLLLLHFSSKFKDENILCGNNRWFSKRKSIYLIILTMKKVYTI